MQFDATGASLPDLFRSLNVDPEEKEALIRLAESVRRLEHEREYQAMLFGEPPPPPPPPPSPPRRRRTPPEKRWLKAVPGTVPIAAAGRWLMRSHAHRALTAGLIVATASGATLAPDMLQPAPAAQLPHHHAVVHHRHREPAAGLPPVLPPRRKRRREDRGGATPSAPVSPSPAVSPSPSPPVPDPVPSPLPSVTVPPVPTPAPTCTLLHGNHCHSGDEVVVAGRALRGLLGLS